MYSIHQAWADAFRSSPDLTGVVHAYEEMKRKGIEFPQSELETLSPIHTPQRVGVDVRYIMVCLSHRLWQLPLKYYALIIYLTLSLYLPSLSLHFRSLSCSVDNSCKVLQSWTSRNIAPQSSPSHSLTLPPLLLSLSLWPTLLHRCPICKCLGPSTLPLNRYWRTFFLHSFKWDKSTFVFIDCIMI